MSQRPRKTGLDLQMFIIRERDDLIKAVNELSEGDIAIMITRVRDGEDQTLRIITFGEGRETDFLGMLGYANIMTSRNYFVDDDEP